MYLSNASISLVYPTVSYSATNKCKKNTVLIESKPKGKKKGITYTAFPAFY